jgi:hypothetical protein
MHMRDILTFLSMQQVMHNNMIVEMLLVSSK